MSKDCVKLREPICNKYIKLIHDSTKSALWEYVEEAKPCLWYKIIATTIWQNSLFCLKSKKFKTSKLDPPLILPVSWCGSWHWSEPEPHDHSVTFFQLSFIDFNLVIWSVIWKYRNMKNSLNLQKCMHLEPSCVLVRLVMMIRARASWSFSHWSTAPVWFVNFNLVI